MFFIINNLILNGTLINSCLLCLKHNENLINILNDTVYKPNISKILTRHFWFETDNNIYSNYICATCWNIVESFHVFYEKILEGHKAFYSKISYDGLNLDNQDSFKSNYTEIISMNYERTVNNLVLISEDKEIFTLNDVETKSANGDSTNDDEVNLIQKTNDICDSDKPMLTKTRISRRLSRANMKREKNVEDSIQIENEDDEIRKYYNMECELCCMKFNVFQDAKTHYRIKHSINGYLSCCGKKFRKRCYVLEHIRWHLNPNEFMCKICNRKYVDKRGLQIHQHTHLPVNMKPFKCPKCPQSFAKNFLLRQHQVKHITDEEKSFFCEDCGKAFATKCLLQFHKRGAHDGAFIHVCEICAKSFKSRVFYRNHMKNVHSTIEKPRVQCDLCSAWLKHEYSLRKHMARHEDSNNTYICHICGKQSPNRGALKSHQAYVHASERTHKCKVCSKAFKKAVGLKEHMAIHTGEVLYTCPHCPKTFSSSANMHSHRKKMHPKEWENNRRNKIMVYNQNLDIPSLGITANIQATI